MIAYVKGEIFSIGLDHVIIDNYGIGYFIYFAHPETVKEKQTILLHTYQNVREDDLSLFGFIDQVEKNLFLQLISVKGVGPKTVMAILRFAKTEEIITAIEVKDLKFLKSLPGIGAKTASQIILDLQGKLVNEQKNIVNQNILDALEALQSLGYKKGDLKNLTNKLKEHGDLKTEEYLKIALAILHKKQK